MKIKLENKESLSYHGVSLCEKGELEEESTYFCCKGLMAVLGAATFSEIEISRRSFKGATKIQIKGQVFSSEKGEYKGCVDHPEAVAKFLKRKEAPEFSFWAKIVK